MTHTVSVGARITLKTLSARLGDAIVRTIYQSDLDLTVDEVAHKIDASDCQAFGRCVSAADLEVVRNMAKRFAEAELA